MFTGIVEGTGRVVAVEPGPDGSAKRLRIDPAGLIAVAKPGDSVAINGVCLTVVAFSPGEMAFDVVAETLKKTTLGTLRPGDPVNLERPMRADGRLDGHFVLGHVDGVGTVVGVDAQPAQTWMTVELPLSVAECCVDQGSITLDGVSLTIAQLDWPRRRISVALIPTTLALTTLKQRPVGAQVNLEADVLGKYVVSYLRRWRGVPAALS